MLKTEPMIIHVTRNQSYVSIPPSSPNLDDPANMEAESEKRSDDEDYSISMRSSAHLEEKQSEPWTDEDLAAIFRGSDTKTPQIQRLDISKMVPGEVYIIC